MEMTLDVKAFLKAIEEITFENGRPFARAYELLDQERQYGMAVVTQLGGHVVLSDGFKCFFLESVELLNSECRPKVTDQLSEFYPIFVVRLVHGFQSLFAAERVAMSGYPYHAYTLLRNSFDNILLTSAAMQRMTDFYSIEGIDPLMPLDIKGLKKKRKEVEYQVRKKMVGSESNLSQSTIDALKKWDELFDYEVHGSRLSLADSQGWLKGIEPLPVLPTFKPKQFAIFANRFTEIGWMLCRLVPLLQPANAPMSETWKKKWQVIDTSFGIAVESLSEVGKKIGTAMVEFVKAKFPFSENSAFPL